MEQIFSRIITSKAREVRLRYQIVIVDLLSILFGYQYRALVVSGYAKRNLMAASPAHSGHVTATKIAAKIDRISSANTISPAAFVALCAHRLIAPIPISYVESPNYSAVVRPLHAVATQRL